MRARLKGLLRNAAVAAGNLRRKALEGALRELAGDETKADSVRQAAQWALGRIENPFGY
jgi:epoxyqueuosine reductase QueG